MSRPVILDLFAGAGGCARGYHDAGFDVVGVDIVNQPRYPYEFHRGDALTLGAELLASGRFTAVHASPPCKDHNSLKFARRGAPHGTGWMLAATIEWFTGLSIPWVIENVPRAHMPGHFVLCGRSFGLGRLKRHRQFLTSFPIGLIPPCGCRGAGQALGVYGDLSRNDRKITNGVDGYVRMRAGVESARDLLGCPWMEADELTQAIPPAYTEFVGAQLLDHLAATVTT